MSSRTRFIAFLLAIALVAAPLAAQWETNGPNATLTMQGLVPSAADQVTHNVKVATPGGFNITIDSGANGLAGVIMLLSLADPNGSSFIPTPLWGGQIDVGNGVMSSVVIVADGLGFTVNPSIDQFYRTSLPTILQPQSTFTQYFTASQFLCNTHIAWQAVVQDPANGPIFVDNTECGDANFVGGQEFILLAGDDGIVNVPFITGNTFPFHGVAYTDVYVVANGYMSFGSASTLLYGGRTIDANAFANAEPAISACQADWYIGAGGPTDGVYYSETGNSVLISWGDPRGLPSGTPGMRHYGGLDTNNQFDVTMELSVDPNVNVCGSVNPLEGTFTIAYPRVDFTSTFQGGDGLLGHTSGGAAILANAVVPVSSDLEGAGVTITNTAVPAIEEHNRTGGNASTLGWDGAGAARAYNEIRNWGGNAITFSPVTSVIAGDLGYVGLTANFPADDVQTIDVPSFSNAGGATITATGKFFGFGAGTVTITDSTSNTIAATATTVFGGTGPFFANEGLTFVTPTGLATGPATINFNFGSGYTASLPTLVTAPCQVITTVPEGDDTSVWVPLTGMTLTHYGVNYTGFYLNSNGNISFSSTSTSYTPTTAYFFNGMNGIAGNASICWMWCDLYQYAATFTVVEDPCVQTVTCSMTNMSYFTTPAAGNCTVVMGAFGPDSGFIDWNGILSTTSTYVSVYVGLSDGLAGGVDTTLAFGSGFEVVVPGYTSTSGPESILEVIPGNVFAATTAAIGAGTGIMNWINGAGLISLF